MEIERASPFLEDELEKSKEAYWGMGKIE